MRQYRTYVTTCYKPDIPDSIYDVKPLRRPRGKVFFAEVAKHPQCRSLVWQRV